jgi:hypothetical protein
MLSDKANIVMVTNHYSSLMFQLKVNVYFATRSLQMQNTITLVTMTALQSRKYVQYNNTVYDVYVLSLLTCKSKEIHIIFTFGRVNACWRNTFLAKAEQNDAINTNCTIQVEIRAVQKWDL